MYQIPDYAKNHRFYFGHWGIQLLTKAGDYVKTAYYPCSAVGPIQTNQTMTIAIDSLIR